MKNNKISKTLIITLVMTLLVSNLTVFAKTEDKTKVSSKPKIVTVEELVKDEAFQNRYIDVVHPSMPYYEWTKTDKEYMNKYIGKNLSAQEEQMLKQEMVDLQNQYYKYYNNYVETNNIFYFPRTQLEIAEAIGRGINARFNALYDTSYYDVYNVKEGKYPERGRGNLKHFSTEGQELQDKEVFNFKELDIDLQMIDKINNLPFNTNGMRNAKVFKDSPFTGLEEGKKGKAGTSANIIFGSTSTLLHELGHLFDSVYVDSYEDDYYKFRPTRNVSALLNGKGWAALPMENFAEDFKYVMEPTENSYPREAGKAMWGQPNEKEKKDLRNHLIQKANNDESLYYSRHYVDGNIVFLAIPYVTKNKTVEIKTELPKGANTIIVNRRKDMSNIRTSEKIDTINIDSPNVKVVDKGSYNEVSFKYTLNSEGFYAFINEENPEKRHIINSVSVFYDSSLPSPQRRDIVYPKNQFSNEKLAKPVMKHNIHNSEDFFVGHVREGQVLRRGIYTAGVSHVYTKRNTFFYEVTANDKVIYEENVSVGFTFDDWVHHSVNYFNRAYMHHSDLFGEKIKDANEVKVTFYGDKTRKEKLDEFKIKLVDPNGTNVSDVKSNTQTPSEKPNAKSKYIVSLNAVPINFTDDLGHPRGNGNGRTMIPVRIVSEQMGYDVVWDNANKIVTIKDKDTEIKFKVGENTALVNGKRVPIDLREEEVNGEITQIAADTKSEIMGNRTYVPLRFVSEAMGAKVDWISKDGSLLINIEKK